MTTFQPPINEGKLWEAMTSAFTVEEIVRDRGNHRKIRGVMYGVGNPADFDQNIVTLREEIEANTGYSVAEEVIRVGTVATAAASTK